MFPFLAKNFWGVVANATQRAYNNIYCAVRNTPGRLDTLYGYQNTFYLNGLMAMWEATNAYDGFPAVARLPLVGILFQIYIYALNALALVWTWDWSSVDDSGIVPEATPKPKKPTTVGDGSAEIGG